MNEKDTNKAVFSIKSLLGVFLVLIAVAGFLGASRGVADNTFAVILTYIFTFPSLYLGGIVGYWAGTLLFIGIGFFIALFRKKVKPGCAVVTILGLFLIYLGALMIGSMVVKTTYLDKTSSNFHVYNINISLKFFNELMFDTNGVWNSRATDSLMLAGKLGGGFFGFLLSGLLATAHDALVYVVTVLLILGGIFLVFRKTIINIFKKDNKPKKNEDQPKEEPKSEEVKESENSAPLFIEQKEEEELVKEEPAEEIGDTYEPLIDENIPSYKSVQEAKQQEEYYRINEERIKEEQLQKEFEYNLKSFNKLHGLSKASIEDIDGEEEKEPEIIDEEMHKSVLEIDEEPKVESSPVIFDEEEEEEKIEAPIFTGNDFASKEDEPVVTKDLSDLVVEDEKEVEIVAPKKEVIIPDHYDYPPVSLLVESKQDIEDIMDINSEKCNDRIEKINRLFTRQGIDAYVEDYTIGPCITRFNVNYGEKGLTKHVKAVEKDISRILGGFPVRFEETVLGMETSGLEVANEARLTVTFRECFEQLPPRTEKNKTMICLGKDINNQYINANISKGPHMLLAGTTGSGKSVFMNSIIVTLIMRNSPKELRLIMVDPKRVEMTPYEDLPHLLCPIITDPFKAKSALEKLVKEMDIRYDKLREKRVNRIEAYNALAEAEGFEPMPTIICLIDEFADLADNCKDVSKPVAMLGQKSRACGIHIVLATQRPTTNIVNGTIKSNLAFRVALSVKTYTDSSVILDEGGAESLLGNGDMLVSCPEIVNNALLRCQGSYLSDEERDNVVEFIKKQWPTDYDDFYMNLEGEPKDGNEMFEQAMQMSNTDFSQQQNIVLSKEDALELNDNMLYEKIKDTAMGRDYISKSFVQNTFKVGFNRACQMISRLAEEGVIARIPEPGAKGFKVLMHGGYEPSENNGSEELITETIIEDDTEE